MKLIDYMKLKHLTNTQIVDLLEENSEIKVDHSYVSHLKYGRRVPSLPVALAIEKATKGRVKCMDWGA